MLSHLVIRNFAIIEELEIPFRPGFTVFTGETGAGKSIIVEALNLLLGGRASRDLIRTEEEEAAVEGIFEPDDEHLRRLDRRLEASGIDSDDRLVVRRRVRRGGRNKVFVNGSLTTVSTLRELTRGLVDISGQHEHYSLLDSSVHLDILDAFGDHGDLLDEMAEAYGEVQQLADDLRSLRADARDRLNRIDFLEYQLREIEDAGLRAGELEELEDEFSRLKYAEEIGDAAGRALDAAYDGPDAAVDQLGRAVEALREAAARDDDLDSLVDEIDGARIRVEEASRQLQRYVDEIEADPSRLDAVVERIDEINRLEQKHAVEGVEGLLERADDLRDELDTLRNAEERTEELESRLHEARRGAYEVARRLSAQRRKVAEHLRDRVESELADLAMDDTRFRVDFAPGELPDDARLEEAATAEPDELGRTGPALSETGFDDVRFLIAPNIGEAPEALADIASGGELSRIMLAIKSILMDRDSVETYVFDEVDTGIGGETAEVVGQKIRRTADSHQIACITHLPQIAARADHHYRVEKTRRDGRTHSTVESLDEEERVEEIARMVGGTDAASKTREAARELLEA
ncbi:MAG: DNA repair protein RecN [Bradymonadaceae bacterium]